MMKTYSPQDFDKGQLTAKELSKYTSMSWNSIQKYLFPLDNFPKKKIGNKWYFHKEMLDAFLEEYYASKAA